MRVIHITYSLLLIFSLLFISCDSKLGDFEEEMKSYYVGDIYLKDDFFRTEKNRMVQTEFLLNDSISFCEETLIRLESLPQHGSIMLDSTGYYYIPDYEFIGTDAFTYSVSCNEKNTHFANVTIEVITW